MLVYEKIQPIVVDNFKLFSSYTLLLGKGCGRYCCSLCDFSKKKKKSKIFGLTIAMYDNFKSYEVYFHDYTIDQLIHELKQL